MMTEGGATPQERLDFACRLALSRLPKLSERSVLLGIFNDAALAEDFLMNIGKFTK